MPDPRGPNGPPALPGPTDPDEIRTVSDLTLPDPLAIAADSPLLDALAARSDLPLFGAMQLDFAAALSRRLTTSAAVRAHPELVALGFWLRPAHLRRLVEATASYWSAMSALRVPRGLALHIAPGNVDTIFVYSWLVGLLCGNRSIVRLSSRHGPQALLLQSQLAELLADPAWAPIAERVAFVRYGHDDAVTTRLSARCDLRVVWGGDATVRAVRALPLPPHATELCFADKFSLTVLRAAHVAALDDSALAALAKGLAGDTYTFAQRACSSPRLVLWQGGVADTALARERLWPLVEAAVPAAEAASLAALGVDKRIAADLLAMDADVRIESTRPALQRIWLDEPAVHAELHCGGGLFHEARIDQLADLRPLLSRRVQTVSQAGFARDEWLAFVRGGPLGGIDRIVPVGRALDFAPVWDGHDLWHAFTRQVDLAS